MTQKNMISFKQTHANENNSCNNHSQCELNKYSGVPWKQHSLSKSQALLLSLKEQKMQDDGWFYCKQVQEMPLRTEMPL